MKPPFVRITAECRAGHGQFQVDRKPNKRQAQRSQDQGFYDAVKCPVCPWWATITDQIMITADPAEPDTNQTATLPGMED